MEVSAESGKPLFCLLVPLLRSASGCVRNRELHGELHWLDLLLVCCCALLMGRTSAGFAWQWFGHVDWLSIVYSCIFANTRDLEGSSSVSSIGNSVTGCSTLRLCPGDAVS